MTTLRIGQLLLLLATSSLLFSCTKGLTEILTIDVCKTCHPNATCIERKQKYSCMCNFGLIGNGRTECTDKDECNMGAQKICGEHTECHNTHGSYYCICLKGYRPSNNHDNFIPNDGTFCTDIDECEVSDICGENAKCKNIPGSYECYCNDGYNLQNASEPFQADSAPSLCKAVDCGLPPAVPHSEILLLGNTTFGSYVTIKCMVGFHVKDGQNTSMCTANGTWEDVNLTCEAVDCGQPPVLQNTHTDTVSLTTFGSKVIYRCDDGFIVENNQNDTALCSDDGLWHGLVMNCKAVDCGLPQSMPHTVIHSFNSSTYRSKVTFTCSKGFVVESGYNTSVCNDSGHWEGANLVCKVADCGSPPSIQNAMAAQLWNTTYGSTLFFHCLPGYIMASGHEIATCNEDGKWDGANLVCREINCGQPPSVPNTEREWNGSTKPGSEVRYMCLKGFYNPDIWHVSRCTFNESWENPRFLCTEVDCGFPLTIEHTELMWNNESIMGSYVYYKCKPGFRDNGERNFSRCLINSTWKVLNLTCTAKENLIGNLKIFNETCLNWTKNTDLFGWEILYKFSIFGVRLHDKEFVDKKIFNYTTDDENPVLCLELLSDTNYTITMIALSPEIPTVVLTVTMQTSRKQVFGNIILFNDSCLTWTGSSFTTHSVEVYKVFIQGKSWYPQELLQNIMFNFSTEESTPVLCLELPPGAEYSINITESSTDLSAYVILNMTSHESENSINQQTFNKTCLQWNRCLDDLQEIYKLYVKGGRWSPKELLQDMLFNINTDQNVTIVCFDLPMETMLPTNISEAHSNLAGGPIHNLTIFNDTCLVWRRESKSAELYVISAHGHKWHQKDFKHILIFNISTDKAHPVVCLDLQKETNYTVEIMSVSYSQYPAQISILSTISEPPLPKVKTVPVNSQLPKISFQRSDKHGHVRSYQVFVIQSMSRCSFTCESLEAVTYFSNISKTQGYVTAEFFPEDTPEHLDLLVGDRQYYGDFYNAPLERGKDYCIILRTVSKMKSHTCMVVAEIEELSTSRHHITVVLLGSVALAFFILLVSYSMARWCNR
ncbi:PREDICTED: sushi domain-containing protein 1 [Nanorana parkeri]|uniref:sushi domain-containing protein 1 n=1 Tax=Nanorana parkeri TaxID=125878 RepID=UPI0008549F27|nr:PREDICTED: sushi domain-containing protein 1 [Nanorana parkeri]